MNVNTNYSPAFSAQPTNRILQHRFKSILHDGSTAHVRINHSQNKVISMECYTFNKDGYPIGGKAEGRNPYMKLVEITNFLKEIQQNTSDNIFQKFSEVLLK